MEEKICETCLHFHRHYGKWEDGTYHPLDWGHCGEPHLRNRRAGAAACPRWEACQEKD